MKEIYNSFRLMGYKINELSNWDFIVLRPDGKKSLFDSNGKIIKGNMREIMNISDELYGCLGDSKVVVINRQGDIIDECTERTLTGMSDRLWGTTKYVSFNATADAKNNIYSLDGKIQIRNVEGYVHGLVCNNGKYKVVYHSNEFHSSVHRLKTIDAEGNSESLNITFAGHLAINNHYIWKTGIDGNAQILDFQGNIICEDKIVLIDNTTMDNDTILIPTEKSLEIKSKLQDIDLRYKTSHVIRNAMFTGYNNIILVYDTNGNYFLNIKTMERTEYCVDISYISNGILVSHDSKKQTTLYKLDLDNVDTGTLNSKVLNMKAMNVLGSHSINAQYISLINDNIETRYSLDFRPLIYEFE